MSPGRPAYISRFGSNTREDSVDHELQYGKLSNVFEAARVEVFTELDGYAGRIAELRRSMLERLKLHVSW
jgi:hypothetical protein